MTQGIRAPGRMRILQRPLAEWIRLNDRLGKDWSKVGDAPWWHIERALVGLFAGAVWRCGGDAFEEYSEHKRKARKRSAGRIDLWFKYRGEEFKAEAKQCWVRSHEGRNALTEIVEVMNRARSDAERLSPMGMRRLAMVFGAVLIPKGLRRDIPRQVEAAVKLATQSEIEADAVAWVFPKLKRPLLSSDGYVLPGIIIWIKEVRRPHLRIP